MRKFFTKIICFTAAAVVTTGVFLASACSSTFKSNSLGGNYSEGTISSNGGFAVEKGNYIYFINGKEAYTADNTYGNVVKGAIMRISKSDFAARNYSETQTVVPQIVYSGNNNAGIFVYGDYVYYATPSTEKNSDGEIQNSYLAFKRAKLDGTEVMKDYYTQYSDNSIEYRYVEEDGVVYLIYVATSETLYGESSGTTNIHSYNTNTGKDTLLAYNVDSYAFDKNDLTNPRIFYTMKVPDYLSGKTSSFSTYNQVYTVTADATEAKDYSEYIKENVTDYDEETDGPLYVNCGTLVLDGIGYVDGLKENVTPFNGADADKVDRTGYTYSISSYQSGNLFYTRTRTSTGSASAADLFSAKVTDITGSSWNPVTVNDTAKYLIQNSTASSSYIYLFDENNNIENIIIAASTGLIRTELDENGIIPYSTDSDIDDDVTFYMTKDGQANVLFVDYENHYIYYSLTGGNGYTINRISYNGASGDYNQPVFGKDTDDCTPIRILDLDSASDWYKPEMFDGQIVFPTQTTNMTDYAYIMVCDLRNESGSVMDNKEVAALNEQFESVAEKIADTDETIYENLTNALYYAYYTSDSEYLGTLIKAYVDIMDYDEEHFWSKESVEKYNAFIAAEKGGEWDELSATVKVNGNDVAANKRDYYYALLGKMNDADAEAYADSLKTLYLQEYPVSENTWFQGLSTGAKVGFIIGVCAGGLAVIAAVAIVVLVIIKKRKEKLPEYKKKRIKVDTTDDKNIDVYSDEQ